eukprot:2554340-Rhodomonas_salina.1
MEVKIPTGADNLFKAISLAVGVNRIQDLQLSQAECVRVKTKLPTLWARLRSQAADTIENEKSEAFKLVGPANVKQYSKYLREDLDAWGGETEIVALTQVLKRQINVVDDDGILHARTCPDIQLVNPPSRPIWLILRNQFHYNAAVPVSAGAGKSVGPEPASVLISDLVSVLREPTSSETSDAL